MSLSLHSYSGYGLFSNPDGIRCWMPCIDSPEQRTHFDISITAPAVMSVACTGKLTSVTDYAEDVTPPPPSDPDANNSNGNILQHMKTSRFVTETAIPPMSVGLFVGYVDAKFSMPLYRCTGHIWTASVFSPLESSNHHMDVESMQAGKIIEEKSIHKKRIEKKVKQSLLGLDQACKHVHKYVGRGYPHKSYTQVL